ncbi:MAG: DMT family transporter, partial [Bacteroidales bacterium]|nr:DMT family transporter [Bacteroidales bacterium]
MSQSNYSAGIVFAVVASVIFGLIPLFSVPLMKAGLSVSNVVCYRFAFSTVAMAVVMAVRHIPLKVSLREYGALLMLSFFYAMTALLLTASYQYIPTGIATTIHFLYPVWVTLLTFVLFKDSVSKPTIIAMICAIGGVAMLSLSGTETQHISGKGLAIVLGTVVAYGSYLACLPKTSVKSMDGLKVTFWLMLNCTMIFALNIIVHDGISGFQSVPNAHCWINLLLVSLLPTLGSNLTLLQAMRRIGATATSVMGSLEPLT